MSTSNKKYDLLDRTQKFAKRTRSLLSKIPKTIPNNEDVKQLARASGSVASNYIEACDIERIELVREATELMKIFGSIIAKSSQ
jgi:hypothetical protein